MKVRFHTEAEAEFNEAMDYYESCEPGLGIEFYVEVHSAVQRILEYPSAWMTREVNVRVCPIHRFPYQVYYSVTVHGVETPKNMGFFAVAAEERRENAGKSDDLETERCEFTRVFAFWTP